MRKDYEKLIGKFNTYYDPTKPLGTGFSGYNFKINLPDLIRLITETKVLYTTFQEIERILPAGYYICRYTDQRYPLVLGYKTTEGNVGREYVRFVKVSENKPLQYRINDKKSSGNDLSTLAM